MIRLLLIRHGATEASENGRLLGSTDVGVSDSGLEEVGRLVPQLTPRNPAIWFCSPMRRTVETLERLCSLGIAAEGYHADTRLREIDLGRWEGLDFAGIAQVDGNLLQAWAQYDDFVFPDGEAVADFISRVREMLATFRSAGHHEIGVVTHGGVIRTMICLALGLDPRHYLLFNVAPASLTILEMHEEGGVLTALNR